MNTDPDNEELRQIILELSEILSIRFGHKYGLLISIKNHVMKTMNTSWINMTKEDNIKALEKGLEKVQQQSSVAVKQNQLLPQSQDDLLFPATVISKAVN